MKTHIDVARIYLLEIPPQEVGTLMATISSVTPESSFQMVTAEALADLDTGPGSLFLMLMKADGDQTGLLRRLRQNGIDSPVIVVSDTSDRDQLAAIDKSVDIVSKSAFGPFTFLRSLAFFGFVHSGIDATRSPDTDLERVRLAEIVASLEYLLTEKESQLEDQETWWSTRLRDSAARIESLEHDLASLQGGTQAANAAAPDLEREVSRLEILLTEAQIKATSQEEEITSLRQSRPLASRLEASERIRQTMRQDLESQQARIRFLEQHLEAIATLLHDQEGVAAPNLEALLEELGRRVTEFENVRSQQQGTIATLSRSLAVQQVDETLDDAAPRRNVLTRIEHAVRRSQRYGSPLSCLMIGIDRPDSIRELHGSVAYDYILVQLAQRLKLTLRASDALMRYSDAGFVLLTDNSSIDSSVSHAKRLLSSVGTQPVRIGTEDVEISVSIVVLVYRREMGNADDLLKRAWALLNRAQRESSGNLTVAD